MHTRIATIFTLGEPVERHFFQLADWEDSDYEREIASYERTCEMMGAILSKHVSSRTVGTKLFMHIVFEDMPEYAFRYESSRKMAERHGFDFQETLPALPTQWHDSLWSLYQTVGYDPEARAFSSERLHLIKDRV